MKILRYVGLCHLQFKLPAIYMIAELRIHPKWFQTGHVFSFCTHDRCNGGTLASSTPSIMFFMSLLALARIQLWCYRQCWDIDPANISHNIPAMWILILQAIDLNISLKSSFREHPFGLTPPTEGVNPKGCSLKGNCWIYLLYLLVWS